MEPVEFLDQGKSVGLVYFITRLHFPSIFNQTASESVDKQVSIGMKEFKEELVKVHTRES